MTDVEQKLRIFGYSPKPDTDIWEYKIPDWYPSGTIKEVLDIITENEVKVTKLRDIERESIKAKRLAEEKARLKKEWSVYWLIQVGQLTFALLCLYGIIYMGKLSGEFFKLYGDKPLTLTILSGYLIHLVACYYMFKSAGTLFGFLAEQKRPS